MSISEKLTAIAENEQRVYDAGVAWLENALIHQRTAIDKFSSTKLFEKADLTGYTFKKTYRPKGSLIMTFYDYKGTELPKNMDFSGVTSVYDSMSAQRQLFMWSTALKEIPDYGLGAITLGNSFDYCRALVTIEKIRITKTITPPTFKEVISLVNIRFEGEIGQSISFSSSSKLSIESLRNIISCLYDFVGNGETTTQTLTLHATAKARLTEDDIKTITDKGWTLV